jgi:hypothetical protein
MFAKVKSTAFILLGSNQNHDKNLNLFLEKINNLLSMDSLSLRSKILLATGLIMIPIAIGVLGYILIEEVRFLDALYMTIITVTTIGYGEIFPLSDAGRVFTICLILGNLGIFAYAITLISRFLIEGNFFYQLNQRKLSLPHLHLKALAHFCNVKLYILRLSLPQL